MLRRILITIICLISFSQNSWADTNSSNWYQIDLIVVKHLNATNLTSEQWSQPTMLPSYNQSTVPAPPTSNIQSQLQKLIAKLQHDSSQQIVLTKTWQQQIFPDNSSLIFHITGGAIYPDRSNELDGTISIRLNRYFTLATNLLLTEPRSTLDAIGSGNYGQTLANKPLISFQLRQQRRLRSNELNYLDHPLFGLLIKITPIAAPVTPTDAPNVAVPQAESSS